MGRSDDDDDKATKPYQTIRRRTDDSSAPKRRKKVQVRPADDGATASTKRQSADSEPHRRPRIKTRSGRRPPTAPVERVADLEHIGRLLRRSALELIYEQRELGMAWVVDDKKRLHVYDGERLIDDFWATSSAKAREEQLDALLAEGGRTPAALRRTLWRTDVGLFIELELLGRGQLFISRGVRQGPLHTERVSCDGVAGARKVLRQMGRVYQDFIEVEDKVPLLRKQRREQGGHAHLPLIRVFRRPVRGGTREAFVAVSGCRLYTETELASYADRVDAAGVIELASKEQAESALEKWIVDHRRERYFLETLTYDNARFVG